MLNTQDHFVRVPETFEGWAVLHEFFRIDWAAVHALSEADRQSMVDEWRRFQEAQNQEGYRTAYFGVLGHKGDLLAIHFKKNHEELLQLQNRFSCTTLARYAEKTHSYVSVVELGVYEYTVKLEEELLAKGLAIDSPEWSAAWKASMLEQRERMRGRMYTDIPKNTYVCFYPMNKRRGEHVNWYSAPMKKRQEMMREHGLIGRKYAGQVTQIISGSIGFDDWEWGVDLFSDDALVFKKLVYEMRFDEASAAYGEFGSFFLGVHLSHEKFSAFLSGQV